MTKGKYLVMWQVRRRVPKEGLINSLLGKKKNITEPVIHSYESEEVAEYGFQNLKSNGCIKPVLLKVIRE